VLVDIFNVEYKNVKKDFLTFLGFEFEMSSQKIQCENLIYNLDYVMTSHPSPPQRRGEHAASFAGIQSPVLTPH